MRCLLPWGFPETPRLNVMSLLHVGRLVLNMSKYLIRLPNTSAKDHQRVRGREVARLNGGDDHTARRSLILNLVTSIVCQRPTTRSARMHGFTRDQLREAVQNRICGHDLPEGGRLALSLGLLVSCLPTTDPSELRSSFLDSFYL